MNEASEKREAEFDILTIIRQLRLHDKALVGLMTEN